MPDKQKNIEKPKEKNKLKSDTENDPFRNGFIRLFGYSHIIGQSTEHIVCLPNFTKLCTSVSILYCLCDVHDKYKKASNNQQQHVKKVSNYSARHMKFEPSKPYLAAGNAAIWQSFASFLIPIFVVNRITYITKRVLYKMTYSKNLKFYLPSIIGILSIPLIMTPIDNGVTKLMEVTQTLKQNDVKDSYRDTYLRLCGYAYVISKTAYRGLHSKRSILDLCYGISVLYCFGDTIDKCNLEYVRSEKELKDSNKKINIDYKFQTIITAIDVLIWQALASFILPGYILSNVKLAVKQVVKRVKIRKSKIKSKLPPIVALLMVPFIVIPIDRIVDSFLEQTYRKLFK